MSGDGQADCAVFSEVIEHLNPHYVGHTLSEINRVLKNGGGPILTTPNIASLFRRLGLLLGIQPQYVYHVHEYTMREVVELLEAYSFKILEARYSDVNDLTFVDARSREEYLKLGSYSYLVKLCLKEPRRLNLLRALAYPLVKAMPSLRMLIEIIAVKEDVADAQKMWRWG